MQDSKNPGYLLQVDLACFLAYVKDGRFDR